MIEPGNLRTVRQLLKDFPSLNEAQLRRMLDSRGSNGLAGAVVKQGRRLFIDLEGFRRWFVGEVEKPRPSDREVEAMIRDVALARAAEQLREARLRLGESPPAATVLVTRLVAEAAAEVL